MHRVVVEIDGCRSEKDAVAHVVSFLTAGNIRKTLGTVTVGEYWYARCKSYVQVRKSERRQATRSAVLERLLATRAELEHAIDLARENQDE